jgi:O-antigen/teichoic acid export membrane protein
MTTSAAVAEVPTRAAGGEAPAAVSRVVRNSTLNLLAQGLNAAFRLGVILLLTRVLSKDALGEFFTLFALILVVQPLAEGGISTVLTRRLAQRPESLRQTLAEAAGLGTLSALLSFLVFLPLGTAWCAAAGDWGMWPGFVAAGVACAGFQVQRCFAGAFRAFDEFGPENWATVLQGAAFAVLVTALFLSGPVGLSSVVAMLAVSHVLAAAYLVVRLVGRWPLGWRLNRAVLRDWLREGVHLGVGDMVRGMTWQLDTILLGLMQPAAIVGLYSVAYRPLGPLNWLPRAVLTAAFPSFARMAAADGAGLQRAFVHSVRLLWIVSLPIAVVVCICAEPLVLLLGGPDYLEAAVPLRILIWVAVLSFISLQFRFLFAAVGRLQVFARLVILVFVVELVVETALIPWAGYLGACAGTVLGEVVFTAAGLYVCRRMGVAGFEWGAMGRAALAGAAMAVPLWFVRGWRLELLIPAAALATVFYVALCVLLGALRWEEARRFGAAFSGLAGRRGS